MQTASQAQTVPRTGKLTVEEVERFHEDGFLGPFVMHTPEQMVDLRAVINQRVLDHGSPLYDTSDHPNDLRVRDRHLDSRTVFELCSNSAIVDRVTSLLGPDLLLWRSQFFIQGPEEPRTAWHQDKNFSGKRRLPALDPATNITAWMAIEDATENRGCIQLVRGSHKLGIIPEIAAPAGRSIFGKGVELAYALDESKIVTMSIPAGSFFLFDDLTVHGSLPNLSGKVRMGLSVRLTTPAVRVYPGLGPDDLNGQGMNIDRFGSILVRGLDRQRLNPMRSPPTD